MKKNQFLLIVFLVSFLQTYQVNAQFGKLGKKIKKTSKSVSENSQSLMGTKKLLTAFFEADFNTYPQLIASKSYKEQVRNSGAVSRINKVDQLINLYLRDKSKWEVKGFAKYQGFLKSRIARLEPGVQGVQEAAPGWFMLPFYHKTVNDIKKELQGKTAENETLVAQQHEQELQAAKDQEVSDSLAYVKKVYDEFKLLTQEGPHQKEEAITSEFHKKNVGKIVFSTSKIEKNAPATTKTTTQFTSNDEIYMAAYLDKAIRNTYYKPEHVEKELYKDLLLSPESFDLTYYIDGKEFDKKGFYADLQGQAHKDEEPLAYFGDWHAKRANGSYTATGFIEVMRKLPKGKHTVKIVGTVSTSLTFKDPDISIKAYYEENRYEREELWESAKKSIEYNPGTPIFEGEFTINILGPMKSGYKWSATKTGALNARSSIKTGIKKAAEKEGLTVVGVKIESDDYKIARNKYNGAILYRYVIATVAFKRKENGLIYRMRKDYKQRYDGSKYQSTWSPDGGVRGGVIELLDM